MYSKEMKGRNISTITGAGGGDTLSSPTLQDKSREGFSRDRDGGILHEHKQENDFQISYGNYGDPCSFLPYQLILILVDFVCNWIMDLVHENPLAVLVIYVFQSLAVVTNIILYLMASASQAMQAGIHKRVNIHHWLNLSICLIYTVITSWWFIWALRKSWPSVSDQFSFTWRSDGIKFPNGTSIMDTATFAPPEDSDDEDSETPQIKEHYTLWSPGFNAVYVIHRTMGLIYYFMYMRATFLVLNSQKVDKFIEMKRELARRVREEKSNNERKGLSEKWRKVSRRLNSFPVPVPTTGMQIGLDEYLSGNGFVLEKEGLPKDMRKGKKKPTSVLWADDIGDGRKISSSHYPSDDDEEVEMEETGEPVPREPKKVKGKPRKKRQEEGDRDQTIEIYQDENESNRERGTRQNREDETSLPRPKPRPRSSRHDKGRRGRTDSADETN